MSKLNDEIIKIKERNKKVETDKAWETSLTRKLSILLLTYVVIAITLQILGLPKPLVNAIIPAIAFFLSTLTIPLFKIWWIENIYKR